MNCVICKKGETKPGKTTLILERDATTLVVKGVPAAVCLVCGEAYAEETAAREVLRMADEAMRSGVQVEIREFAAAI